MGKHVDPGQWEHDVEEAETKIAARSAEERRRRYRRRDLINRGWLGVASAFIVLGFIFLSGQQGQINKSRADNVRSACQELNRTNDRTIRTIDRVTLQRLTGDPVPKTIEPPELRRRLEQAIDALPEDRKTTLRQQRSITVLIIDSLAPRRDCEQRVRKLVTD